MSVKWKVFLENPWYPGPTTLAGSSGTSVGFQDSQNMWKEFYSQIQGLLFLAMMDRTVVNKRDGAVSLTFCLIHSGIPVTVHCLAFWNTSRGRLSCLEGKKCCALDWRPLIGHRASWSRSLIYFLQVQTSHFCMSVLCMSIPLFIPPFPYPLTIFLGMIPC